jgi:2'-5' RNA ligase
MNKHDKIRSFISLDFPEAILKQVAQIQNDLVAQNLFVGKYTSHTNIHLTLKFLGEISKPKIEEVKNLLSEITFEPTKITFTEIGVFSKRDIRIIWIKVNGVDDLQKKIDESLKTLFSMEDRFMGHVTIARVKKLKNKGLLLHYLNNYQLPTIRLEISEFKLKQSMLTPAGPIYKILKTF